MKPLHWLICLPFVTFLLAFAPFSTAAVPGTPYVVTEVHDGDTVSLKMKSVIGIPLKVERVRLIGIDAPELNQEPWGRRSKRHLKKLIGDAGWMVHLELDVQERDKHGRLLGYLWTKQGKLLNEAMIEDGFAVLLTLPPNIRYAERFTRAQERARAAQIGIWGKGGLTKSPHQWRLENPRD